MITKRILAIALLGCVIAFTVPQQATAQDVKESVVKYSKETHPGVVAAYSADEDVVRGALLKRLAAAGLTDKKTQKGFYLFRGVNWTEVMAEKVDVYVRVDGNSSKATAYIMISKGYDNFISAATDPEAVDKLKNILNSLTADIEEYKKAQALAEQQAAVEAAAADAKKAQRQAERAAKRSARKQEKLKKQQAKLSEINGQ
jgi:hypothetical protein